MSALQIRRRILGIDLGRARIGVAVSDELGMLAHPVEPSLRARTPHGGLQRSCARKMRSGS